MCAGCNVVHPYAAIIIGVIAGMAYVAWSTAVLYFKIDDPLDAVAGKRTSSFHHLKALKGTSTLNTGKSLNRRKSCLQANLCLYREN